MITWVSQHAAPLVTVSALVLSTFVILARDTARHRRLMRNLALAAEMMDLHTKALDAFCDDDRVPVSIRERMLGFSESIFDPEAFLAILDRACQLQPHEVDTAAYRKERGTLFMIDPKLETMFTTVISSAIVAMILKTHGASVKLDDALARLASIEEEKTFIYMRVSRRTRIVSNGPGSMLAGAA